MGDQQRSDSESEGRALARWHADYADGMEPDTRLEQRNAAKTQKLDRPWVGRRVDYVARQPSARSSKTVTSAGMGGKADSAWASASASAWASASAPAPASASASASASSVKALGGRVSGLGADAKGSDAKASGGVASDNKRKQGADDAQGPQKSRRLEYNLAGQALRDRMTVVTACLNDLRRDGHATGSADLVSMRTCQKELLSLGEGLEGLASMYKKNMDDDRRLVRCIQLQPQLHPRPYLQALNPQLQFINFKPWPYILNPQVQPSSPEFLPWVANLFAPRRRSRARRSRTRRSRTRRSRSRAGGRRAWQTRRRRRSRVWRRMRRRGRVWRRMRR